MATIKGNQHLNTEHACEEVFNAMQSASKDESKKDKYSENEIRIIDVLTNHNNDQRQNIRMKYKLLYGFDLKDHIKTEINGDLQQGLLSILYTPAEYDVQSLQKAIIRMNQKSLSVIEILTTRNSYQLRQIDRIYSRKFHKNLSDDLQYDKDENKDLTVLLRALLNSNRPNDTNKIDIKQAEIDANIFNKASETQFSTTETEFYKVLSERSFEQLRKTFNLYKGISRIDIKDTIKNETTGYYKDSLLAIVSIICDMPRYFAEQLKKDLDNSKKEDFIRTLISRAEIDLEIVKQIYEGIHGHSLYNRISAESFGCYEVLLKSLVKK